MEAVEEIRREGETRLFWRTRIGGVEKSWKAEITSQIPYKQIAWASVDGTQNAGVVTFEENGAKYPALILPLGQIRQLRNYLRSATTIVEAAAQQQLRVQKASTLMNIQLPHVISGWRT
jgi:hypothetical protein